MSNKIEKIIAKTFEDIAQGLETGSFASPARIALTGIGGEHGEENSLEGALAAASKGIEVVYIGQKNSEGLRCVAATDEADAHKKMEELLAKGEIDGVVTMHYPFPIGVSTVGKVTTPGRGKNMYIATTTGTSSTDRIESMILNAIYGIIAAKSCGNKTPTIGILNIDGANRVENGLKELCFNGYPITFAESERADGGCVMRGNDILTGACDVLVCDTLTGNVLQKMLSAYSSGGSYESSGYGYGPGIGKTQSDLVMIVSRASGAPVISGAIEYAADLVRGRLNSRAAEEFAAADKAKLGKVLAKYKTPKTTADTHSAAVKAPTKEVVTSEISGVDVMSLEDAVESLWKKDIYAESGMGCTGPIILVSPEKEALAIETLKADNWL